MAVSQFQSFLYLRLQNIFWPIRTFVVSGMDLHHLIRIMIDRLCKPRQEKVNLPETPFGFEEMIKLGQLMHFSDVTDAKFATTFREPCIVFTGHPSLRFGPVTNFLKMWGSNSKHSLIFIGMNFTRFRY